MADVKALFPIGKTQWSKWSDDQRTAFNEARAEGVPHEDAIKEASRSGWATIVGDVIEVAIPSVVSAVKTVAKATPQKKAK